MNDWLIPESQRPALAGCPQPADGGIAWIAGWVYWSPGGGLWTTNSRIALNVLVNASILGTYGTMQGGR